MKLFIEFTTITLAYLLIQRVQHVPVFLVWKFLKWNSEIYIRKVLAWELLRAFRVNRDISISMGKHKKLSPVSFLRGRKVFCALKHFSALWRCLKFKNNLHCQSRCSVRSSNRWCSSGRREPSKGFDPARHCCHCSNSMSMWDRMLLPRCTVHGEEVKWVERSAMNGRTTTYIINVGSERFHQTRNCFEGLLKRQMLEYARMQLVELAFRSSLKIKSVSDFLPPSQSSSNENFNAFYHVDTWISTPTFYYSTSTTCCECAERWILGSVER